MALYTEFQMTHNRQQELLRDAEKQRLVQQAVMQPTPQEQPAAMRQVERSFKPHGLGDLFRLLTTAR
jgi:hypothetical protein